MFERFTASARQAVVRAQYEARHLGHSWLGTEHILLAVLTEPASAGTAVLADQGVDVERARAELVAQLEAASPEVPPGFTDADRDALDALGIDLDEVRRRIEATFGPGALDAPLPPERRWRWRRGRCEPSRGGHLRFAPHTKKALELSLREALRLGSREITIDHVLLGLLAVDDGMAVRVLRALDVDVIAVRTELRRALGEAA